MWFIPINYLLTSLIFNKFVYEQDFRVSGMGAIEFRWEWERARILGKERSP